MISFVQICSIVSHEVVRRVHQGYIDRALVCGYPKKQQLYSLYLRKAKCLKFLKKDYVGCLADVMKV